MRTLDSNLTKAQQGNLLSPAIKITLTSGATSIELTETRLKRLNHIEEPWHINAKETIFDNSDGYFTDLDLKGYKAVISYGMVTKAGKKYSNAAPMWVRWQTMSSAPGGLTCELTMLGIPDLMDLDEASASYIPASTDTKTVKTLIREIAGDTGVTHLACFNHTQKYNIVFGTLDSLIDSYKPADSFRIYVGGSRLAAMKRLLSYTKCVMRFEDDGKIHVYLATTAGTTYDYEYSLKDPDAKHTFFSKAYRKTLVLPNRVVVSSQPDDDPQRTPGEATSAASYALLRQSAFYQTRLADNAQGQSIAEAIIANLELNSEMGSAEVPMNCGAELYDYVNVTDEREGDNRVGNIGSIIRKYSSEKFNRGDSDAYSMRFSFGDPPTVRQVKELLNELSTSGTTGPKDVSLERLTVKDLYVENVEAGNIDFTDITYDLIQDGVNYHGVKDAQINAEGLIFLDSLVDTAGTYKKVLATQVEAGAILLSSDTHYDTGYDPTEKEVAVHRGTTAPADTTLLWWDTTINQMKRYSGAAWVVATGKWYTKAGVLLDADYGIGLYGGQIALRTYPTYADLIAGTNLQCYVGTDGAIYAGAGAVKLNSLGLTIYGQYMRLYYSTTWIGTIYGDLGGLTLSAQSGYPISLIGKALWLPDQASDPSSPSAGYMYYNRTTNVVKIWNGTAWKTLTWS